MQISGQLGIDAKTGKLVHGGIESEFEQIMKNINAILTKAESKLGYVLTRGIGVVTDLAGYGIFR